MLFFIDLLRVLLGDFIHGLGIASTGCDFESLVEADEKQTECLAVLLLFFVLRVHQKTELEAFLPAEGRCEERRETRVGTHQPQQHLDHPEM